MSAPRSVPESADLTRVLALPRRTWAPDQAAQCAQYWTEQVRLPPAERLAAYRRSGIPEHEWPQPRELGPLQGIALQELVQVGGLFAALVVGRGKTDLAHIAPLVLTSRRPMLMIPGGMRTDTELAFSALQREWRSPEVPSQIETYEHMALSQSEDRLKDPPLGYGPDLIILDEAHKLLNHDAAVVQRIARRLLERPDTKVVVLTGTALRKDIKNISHLLLWALKAQAPVPIRPAELENWSCALSLSTPEPRRLAPGALARLCPGDVPSLSNVRAGFRRRLAETPGVLIDTEDSCQQPLHVRFLPAPDDPAIDAAFERFRTLWETPDGQQVTDSLSQYRLGNELGQGVWQKWDPPPPEPWREAYRAKCAFVRDMIARSRRTTRPLDTEAQVASVYREAPELVAWRAIRDTFEPNSVACWLSASVVQAACQWLQWAAGQGGGLMWTWNVAMGQAISAASGVPYFGQGGLTADGVHVKAYKGASAVLSLKANSEGRNLQRWNRNCVVGLPQSAKELEQWLGRTHRKGQERDVYVDVIATSCETLRAFSKALTEESAFVAELFGQQQKIRRAGLDRPSIDACLAKTGWRWVGREVGSLG